MIVPYIKIEKKMRKEDANNMQKKKQKINKFINYFLIFGIACVTSQNAITTTTTIINTKS